MLLYFIIPFAGHNFLSFFSVSFGISFEHAVQLPFTVFLYSPFPDNYAFLSLSPSQIKNIQSADTVPVHGHSPLVIFLFQKSSQKLSKIVYQTNILIYLSVHVTWCVSVNEPYIQQCLKEIVLFRNTFL